MRLLDWKSTLVAGLIGAVLLILVDQVIGDESNATVTVGVAGFAVGAGVQVGVRLIGVS
jgi:hypothetical protein